MTIKIISLFSGCGGLDLGFRNAGFRIIWANEFDKDIWKTYEENHRKTKLERRSIREISSEEVPDCIGIIGGPPCQSWSEAGCQKGLNDERGKLYWEYIRILIDKQPKFFLLENVAGMLQKKHKEAFNNIKAAFQKAGYCVSYELLNLMNYNVPQDRERVIFVGYHTSLNKRFCFGSVRSSAAVPILRGAIWDLQDSALSADRSNKTKGNLCNVPNHEYMVGGFSSHYMSRNRVRSWNQPSFTIQAGGRHAPIHPQANKMIKVGLDKCIFDPDSPNFYRRLSVRECARIQTFPDNFIFYYTDLAAGYKMIGNAVPVNFSCAIAQAIYRDLFATHFEITESEIKHDSFLELEPKPIQLSLNLL